MILILAGSIIGWGVMVYYSKTNEAPNYGGEYIEGIVGQPLHINPIISQSNSSDEDLSQIIYSSLLKYDTKGKLKNDLADSYEISDDKTLYTFHLKQNVLWHDGEKLTANDILFTTNLISDPAYKSPLRSNWQSIETSVVNDYTITFKIKSPYVAFLNNLTFGILPQHIWNSVGSDKFPLTNLNLEPIGSGAYKYSSLQKDSAGNIISYKLVANPNYFNGKPYISKIAFNFYPDDTSIIAAYNKKEIMGINSLSPQEISQLKLQQSTLIHKFNTPRYFAVFLNQTKSLPLADDNVRQALAYATDRQEIINSVLSGNGTPVYSPILLGMIGYTDDISKYEFDLEKANKILDDAGWIKGEDGFRGKNGNQLQMELITTDWPELVQTAEILKSQWVKIGFNIQVSNLAISDFQQNYIRTREYDALLFGQVLGGDPDPFSFWHSSQKKDPYPNLSLFGNDTTDKLIEQGRIEFNTDKRASIYKDFQQQLTKEIPAIFLYSNSYVYPVNKKVRGIGITNLISPSARFADINQWYINTKRIWK